MPSVIEGEVDSSAIITDQSISVTQVLEGSPAEVAGILPGDSVISIGGEEVVSASDARDKLGAVAANEITDIVIQREDMTQTLSATPAYIEALDAPGFGLAILETGSVQYPWYLLPIKGTELAIQHTGLIAVALYELVAGLIAGSGVSADVAGPVGIAVMTGEVVQMGLVYLLQFAAILSINLAIINVLPFPALDGGRLLFVAIEAIRRKPVSPKIEAIVHNSGFLILIGIIIIVTYRDFIDLL
jgi:regulator of sigma E protease